MVINEKKEYFAWRNPTCGPTAASIPSCWLVFQTWRQLTTGFPHLLFFYLSVLFGDGVLLLLFKEDHNLHDPISLLFGHAGSHRSGAELDSVLGVLWLDHREIGNIALLSSGLLYTLTFLCETWVARYDLMIIFLPSSTPLDIPLYSLILWWWRLGGSSDEVVCICCPSNPLTPLFFPYCHSMSLPGILLSPGCHQTGLCWYRNRLYPVVLVVVIFVLNSVIILISYVLTQECLEHCLREEVKALDTCGPCICCVLVFYVTVIGLSPIHRFGKHVPCRPPHYELRLFSVPSINEPYSL